MVGFQINKKENVRKGKFLTIFFQVIIFKGYDVSTDFSTDQNGGLISSPPAKPANKSADKSTLTYLILKILRAKKSCIYLIWMNFVVK